MSGSADNLTNSPLNNNESEITDEQASSEVEAFISDQANPIVMFALEWCEFCWSISKLLKKYDIPFHCINIDSSEFLKNNRGRKIRTALSKKTTWNTFPQIFIEGEFIGGCTDLLDACEDGSFMETLEALKIIPVGALDSDPYDFLPEWLQPR